MVRNDGTCAHKTALSRVTPDTVVQFRPSEAPCFTSGGRYSAFLSMSVGWRSGTPSSAPGRHRETCLSGAMRARRRRIVGPCYFRALAGVTSTDSAKLRDSLPCNAPTLTTLRATSSPFSFFTEITTVYSQGS